MSEAQPVGSEAAQKIVEGANNYYQWLTAEHLALAHVDMVKAVNGYLQAVSRRKEDAKAKVMMQNGQEISITQLVERTFAFMTEKVHIVRAYESMMEQASGEDGDTTFRAKVDEIMKMKPLEFDLSAVQ